MKIFFWLKLNCFKYFSSFTLILLFVFSADVASAHRVVIFAWVEGNTVFTQSQFSDGRKVSNGDVHVFDNKNNLLLKGKTDPNGDFSFKIPQMTTLNIVLDAGMGHQGKWKLSEKEIKSSMGMGDEKPMSKQDGTRTDMAETSQNKPSASLTTGENNKKPDSVILLNEKKLKQMIETALDKKIHPISQMLAQMQYKGPSVNDIFGGIGYILGLMGVAAYFLSRKKNDDFLK